MFIDDDIVVVEKQLLQKSHKQASKQTNNRVCYLLKSLHISYYWQQLEDRASCIFLTYIVLKKKKEDEMKRYQHICNYLLNVKISA